MRGDDGDPYRSPPVEPQFVCLVCYRSLSVQPGECPACGVARLALANPEVRDELRAEAERRVQARVYGEWFWCYLVAFLVTTPMGFLAGDLWRRLVFWIVSAMVLGGANVKIYERLAPRSMLRLFADRRRRLLPAPADAPKLLPAHAEDAEDADIRRVLQLLGAKDDTKK
jgi:hypothetical protein